MAELPVTVMLDANISLDAAEPALAAAGLRVTDRLHSIGAFNGSVDERDLSKLKAVPGVINVTVSSSIPGPSPESDIQ